MKQKPKFEIIDYDTYNPSPEDIKNMCDEAYEENKEMIDAIIKGLPND